MYCLFSGCERKKEQQASQHAICLLEEVSVLRLLYSGDRNARGRGRKCLIIALIAFLGVQLSRRSCCLLSTIVIKQHALYGDRSLPVDGPDEYQLPALPALAMCLSMLPQLAVPD